MSSVRVVVFAVMLMLPALVHAQSDAAHAAELATQREALHHQAVVATVAHIVSLAFADYALVAAPLGYFMLGNAPGCGLGIAMCPADSNYVWLMVSGMASGIVASFVLFLALGLDLDRQSRGEALRRETERVRVVPGPGQIGLALSVVLDG